MINAFFISETYLKNNSPLSSNVDIQDLYPYARTAEDMYIQDAIGTSLYDDLKTKIIANTLNTNETELCKKIRECVVWYTCYDALPFIGIKLRNIGVVKQTGEGHESASREDINVLRKLCKDKGDFYLLRLQKYLCEFESLFPAYDEGEDDDLDPNFNAPTPSCDIAFDNHENYKDRYADFYRRWIKE